MLFQHEIAIFDNVLGIVMSFKFTKDRSENVLSVSKRTHVTSKRNYIIRKSLNLVKQHFIKIR